MGNTHADYYALDPAPFERGFLDHPRAVTEAELARLMDASLAGRRRLARRTAEELVARDGGDPAAIVDRLVAAHEQVRDEVLRLIPARDGLRALDLEQEGPGLVAAACFGACALDRAEAWDVLHDVEEGRFALELDDGPAGQAWRLLLQALGIDEEPVERPWWLGLAWDPGGHWLRVTPPDGVQALRAALDEDVRETLLRAAAERDEEGADALRRLLRVIDRAADAGGWFVAIESMS